MKTHEQRAMEQRNLEIMQMYAAGYTYNNIALAYDLSKDRIRQLHIRTCKLLEARNEYRQRTCTPEEVYLETETFRGKRMKMQYWRPYHRKTPRPVVNLLVPPPPPLKPLWIMQFIAENGFDFLGLGIVRADDLNEAMREAFKLNMGSWIMGVKCSEEVTFPGDMIWRFTPKDELIRRGIIGG